MLEPIGKPMRLEGLRASRRSLAGLAPAVQFGLFAVGLGLFLDRVGILFSDVQLTWGERRVAGAVAMVTLVGFGIGGWAAGRLLQTLAELIDAVASQAEASCRAADLLEFQVVPTLARAALALERTASSGSGAAGDDGRGLGIAGVRRAIEGARWERADRLIDAFRRDYPDANEVESLAVELAEARQAAVDDLRARLDAARSVNDPVQVIGYRDELTRHLRGDPLRQLDLEVVRWIMALIQRKLRSGAMRKDVADLAARAADSFGDTPEGASLRAALPTLRRSAGLCPRCARPYPGVDDACPECLRSAGRTAPGATLNDHQADGPEEDES